MDETINSIAEYRLIPEYLEKISEEGKIWLARAMVSILIVDKQLVNEEKGFFKDAVINFVALLGWHPSDNQEIFSLKDLTASFSIEKINKSGAIFDIQKFNWMNSHYIKSYKFSTIFKLCSNFNGIISDAALTIIASNKISLFLPLIPFPSLKMTLSIFNLSRFIFA